MDDCLFCKIIKGDIPSHKVYEDDKVVAFLDVYPATEGFTLVLPKKHSDYIWDMDDDNYAYLQQKVKDIGNHLRKIYQPPWVGIQVEGVGVAHTHVKVFPFSTVEEYRTEPDRSGEPDHEKLAKIAEKLKFS
ncbi:MAG: HIT domain-containing protein [Candidatus Saccharimonadales bacterium]|nr:HIT domain-containing protein [Candidatus Saccharimonadales bacterium]